MKIIWTDKSRKDDPNPSLNNLGYYINRSRIKGIKEAYNLAINKYVQEYNDRSSEIAQLKHEIIILKSQLNVWKEQQHGRRSVLNDNNKKIIDDEKLKGTSNRQIANILGISEGTIRNYLKNK